MNVSPLIWYVACSIEQTRLTLAKRRFRFLIGFLIGTWAAGTPAFGQSAQQTLSEIKDTITRTGISVRADAPLSLRNPDDRTLPIYLEIINGAEKMGYSALAKISGIVKREPLRLEGVNIFVKPEGKRRQFVAEPLHLDSGQDFSYDARTGGQPLAIAERMRKILRIPLDSLQDYLKKNYIGGPFTALNLCVSFRIVGWPNQDFYLRVRTNAPPLPRLPHWYRGDVHYHTAYTDNAAERGYPIEIVKQAGQQVGLDWTLLTDHSCDLTPKKYADLMKDIVKYRDDKFMLIRAEEVTVTSGQTKPTTDHLLAMPSPDDPDKGFPDPADASSAMIAAGDGSDSSPGIPVTEALQRVTAAGGFAYASHPFDPLHPILRGGHWDLNADFLAPDGKKLQTGLVGLESWNRVSRMTADDTHDPFCLRRDADPDACFQPDKDVDTYARLERGIDLGWRPLLLKSLQASDNGSESPAFKVFLAAGSDSHGDLNFEVTLDATNFLARPQRVVNGYAEDNGWGKVNTLAYCPQGMGPRGENILRALREGRTIMTNGPLLMAGFDRNANGSLDDPEDIGIGQELTSPRPALPPLLLAWASSKEFGPLQSLGLIVGSRSGESEALEISFDAAKALASEGLVPVELKDHLERLGDSWGYIRLQARTRNAAKEEYRCYTNPIWVRLTSR